MKNQFNKTVQYSKTKGNNNLINPLDNVFSRFLQKDRISIPFVDEDFDYDYFKKRT